MTAFWFFKRDHGLKGYADFVATPVQEKFASLCKSPEQTAAATPASNAGAPSSSDAGQTAHAVEPAKQTTRAFTPVEINMCRNLLAQSARTESVRH
jgi:hypothetical protein